MKKTILLKSIKLENWSSITCEVSFANGRTKIMGKNGIGKSSIINAWRWLLTSRVDAYHPANYELFDRRYPLTPNTPTAIVEAVITIDGVEYTLTRKAKASFVKGVKSSSDKYTTLIDDIEYTATEFNDWLSHNVCPIESLLYCIDGVFFSTLCEEDKKKGRKVLESIVGEIKQSDFSKEYQLIAPWLNKIPIEKIMEKAKKDYTEIDKELNAINVELDVKSSLLYKCKSNDNLENEINQVRNEIASLDEEINKNSAQAKNQEIFDKINSKRLYLQERRNTYNEVTNALKSEINAKIWEINDYNAGVKSFNSNEQGKISHNKEILRTKKVLLESLENKRQLLLERKDSIKEKLFTDTTCAYCGQELPDAMVEELKAKFNEQKQTELDVIIAEGKSTKGLITNITKEIKELEATLSEPIALKEERDLTKWEKELEKLQDRNFESSDEYTKIANEIKELEDSIEHTNIDSIVKAKNDALDRLQELLLKKGSAQSCESVKQDIDALVVKQRELGNDCALKMAILEECKEWNEERADIISKRINSKLNGCSIQMYSTQKNGEQVPDCVVLDRNGVKYGKTNTAETLLINIALQKLFMEHYKIELPIFVDECSRFSPSNTPNIEGQNILIFATDDETLNVTHE
jgi:chromosome segregation ATPase